MCFTFHTLKERHHVYLSEQKSPFLSTIKIEKILTNKPKHASWLSISQGSAVKNIHTSNLIQTEHVKNMYMYIHDNNNNDKGGHEFE